MIYRRPSRREFIRVVAVTATAAGDVSEPETGGSNSFVPLLVGFRGSLPSSKEAIDVNPERLLAVGSVTDHRIAIGNSLDAGLNRFRSVNDDRNAGRADVGSQVGDRLSQAPADARGVNCDQRNVTS